MAKAVFCIATSEFQAEAIVNDLKAAGFADNVDFWCFFQIKQAPRISRTNNTQKRRKGEVTGASTLGVVGGAFRLAGIGALTVPGLGPFITAGPIMAFGSAAVGATVSRVASTGRNGRSRI